MTLTYLTAEHCTQTEESISQENTCMHVCILHNMRRCPGTLKCCTQDYGHDHPSSTEYAKSHCNKIFTTHGFFTLALALYKFIRRPPSSSNSINTSSWFGALHLISSRFTRRITEPNLVVLPCFMSHVAVLSVSR